MIRAARIPHFVRIGVTMRFLKAISIVATSAFAGCSANSPSGAAGSYADAADCFAKASAVNALNMSVTRSGNLHITELGLKANKLGEAEKMTPDAIQADLQKRTNEKLDPLKSVDAVSNPTPEYKELEKSAFDCAARLSAA